jgi:hypothetical protein
LLLCLAPFRALCSALCIVILVSFLPCPYAPTLISTSNYSLCSELQYNSPSGLENLQ